jgi:alcohol dehydrogenase class IV
MQHSFSFEGIPKVRFGPGAVDGLGKIAASIGKSAILVTGSDSLRRSGRLAEIVDDLQSFGVEVARYPIDGEPSCGMVDEAVRRFEERPVEVVVAVGGGSVLDGGKAIAAMLKESGSVADYLEGVGTRKPSGRSVPLIAVPTTSGTGSEATKNAVLSRVGTDGFKKSLRHDNYIPRVALLDPVLCVSAPPAVTAACGMDALTQLIESYVSTRASPLTDALAMEGLERLIPALPDACATGAADLGCRGAMAYGAFLSGVTLAHAGLGVVHGIAGPMGAIIAIPHGVACANMLPFAVKATLDNLAAADTPASRAAVEKFARIGRLSGASHADPMDRCRHLVDSLYRWLDKLPIPRLGHYGLSASHIERLRQDSSNKNNPLPLSADQVEQMIRDRW